MSVTIAATLGVHFLAWRHWLLFVLLGFQVLHLTIELFTWRGACRALRAPEAGDARAPERAIGEPQRCDAGVGTVTWRGEEDGWCLDHVLDEERILVRLAGTAAGGPSPAAKAAWEEISPRLPEVWARVAGHTSAWAAREGLAGITPQDFAPTELVVSPDAPIDGGELVFHFHAITDPDGAYEVPVADGEPLFVHRSS